MKATRSLLAALATLAISAPSGQTSATGFVDPLDAPAQPSALAPKNLMLGVARAGLRLVAVGQRGHIVYSIDGGATWQQASVPVSSDLTAVFFVNDQKGWAVGHDGIVLNTSDGGLTWATQLDGRRANERLVEYMQKRVDADPPAADKRQLLEEAKRYKEQGADKPFLDVWFADEMNGYVVGAYNLIFHTRDGGQSWEPWFDRTDNPKLLNLHAIRPAAGGLYIAGEGGLALKLDPEAQRFKALGTPYNGSYFGVVGDKTAVLLFGLRGNAFRSDDAGNTWVKVDTGLPATIVAGLTAADGAIIVADLAGRAATSTDGARTFKAASLSISRPLAGIADAGNGRLALAGPQGVAIAELTSR